MKLDLQKAQTPHGGVDAEDVYWEGRRPDERNLEDRTKRWLGPLAANSGTK